MVISVYSGSLECYFVTMNDKSSKAARVMLIVNPVSGGGRSIDLLPEVIGRLAANGVQVDVNISESAAHATEMAYLGSRCGYRRIAAFGGDGTVNMVAAGILGSESSLAVIPAGTGNDFFKLLDISNDLESICRAVASGPERTIDIGLFDNRPFFNMLGIGFDAEVAFEANKANMRLGRLTYFKAVYNVWKKFPVFDLKLRIDSLELNRRVMLVAIGIGRSSGGGFLLTPQAIPNDGKFDVCILEQVSHLKIFSILPRVVRGAHIRMPEIKIYRCRQLEIMSDRPLPIHYEGETMTSTAGRISVKMSTEKLKVVTGVKTAKP